MKQDLKSFLEQKKQAVSAQQDNRDLAKDLWIAKVHDLYQQISTWLKGYQDQKLLSLNYQPHELLDHDQHLYQLDELKIMLRDGSQILFTPRDGCSQAAFGLIEISGPYGKDTLYLTSPEQTSRTISASGEGIEPVKTSYLYHLTFPQLQIMWEKLAWKILVSRAEGELETFSQAQLEEIIIGLTDDTQLPSVREQALHLAQSNKKVEPNIQKVYWFPNEEEIRLVEIEENTYPFSPPQFA